MSNKIVDFSNLALETEEDNWEDTCYIIMWQSSKSGGTYSEMRKTTRGKNRFLHTLQSLGVSLSEVQVYEQPKLWRPEKKDKPKRNKRIRKTLAERRVSPNVLTNSNTRSTQLHSGRR